MTDYDNPLYASPDTDFDLLDQQEANRPKTGFTPLPKGRYPALLTDHGTDTFPESFKGDLAGARRIKATFETEYDGRTRKLFVDMTDVRAFRSDKPGEFEWPYKLLLQLQTATGLRGKPAEALEAARTTLVDLEVGVKGDRNVVYAIHSEAR